MTDRRECVYCGQRLRPFRDTEGKIIGWGYCGDGFLRAGGSPFCSLRCGHRFAVRAVGREGSS